MLRNKYEFSAKIYDPLLFLALNPIRKAILKELIDFKESRILDLCCGTGNQLKMLSKNGFKNLHCLDLSEPMLEVARKGDHSIRIHQEDAARTAFKDKEFDIVILSFALHEKDRQTRLDIIERMAGGEHYLNFKRYRQSGGLSAIIDEKMFRYVKNFRKAFSVVTISMYNKVETF